MNLTTPKQAFYATPNAFAWTKFLMKNAFAKELLCYMAWDVVNECNCKVSLALSSPKKRVDHGLYMIHRSNFIQNNVNRHNNTY